MKPKTGRRLTDVVRKLLILFCVFLIVFPIYWMFLTSIRPLQESISVPPRVLPDPATVTLKHYQRILSGRIAALDVSYGLPTFFVNSLIVGAMTTLISVALSTLAGYALVRLRFAGWRIVSHLIMVCYLIPGIALMLPMFVLAVRLGLNNSLTGLILVQAAGNLPLSIWMLKAYFKSLPEEVDEAAIIDGCGWLRVVMRIVVPMAKPGIMVVCFYSFLGSWNAFALPSVMINDDRLRTVTLGLAMYFHQDLRSSWGEMMAAAVITLVPIFAMFVYFQRYIVGGLTLGAVKG